ncbi:hypothetical protein BKA70DRAFT_384916 [Coprinopsis sp. MPI-PUGE-AT-0042]|nr:hypothetical protein BKA70DRAFT_384916 [Coprinopsis sp. MPI-PUGE-AT-0042]
MSTYQRYSSLLDLLLTMACPCWSYGRSCDPCKEREDDWPAGTFRTGFEDCSPVQGGLHAIVSEGEGYASLTSTSISRQDRGRCLPQRLLPAPFKVSDRFKQTGFVVGVSDLPGKRSEQGIAPTPRGTPLSC